MNLERMHTAAMAVTDEATATAFLRVAIEEIGGGFHPDDGFTDLINLRTGEHLFPIGNEKDDAFLADLEAGLDECFIYVDPSEVCLNVMAEKGML